ncbi:MAG: SDR family NAD(P)-dependent oxidoreductase, partial [Pseudomonadota bacterium]
AYRVSKAAVNKLMQALSGDLKPEGITVVSMHPGWVRTDMGGSNADISVQESASGILSVAERLDLDRAGAFINYDGSPIPW